MYIYMLDSGIHLVILKQIRVLYIAGKIKILNFQTETCMF